MNCFKYIVEYWNVADDCESTSNGFTVASEIEEVTERLRDYYGEDLVSVYIKYIGEEGMYLIDEEMLNDNGYVRQEGNERKVR